MVKKRSDNKPDRIGKDKLGKDVIKREGGIKNDTKGDERWMVPLKKEYDLPPDASLNMILHKMAETLELYLKLIEQILQPEEFHSGFECNAFSDTEKNDLFKLFSRLIIMHREIVKAIIAADDDISIKTIGSAYTDIQEIKPKMIDMLTKMQSCWNKDLSPKGPRQYFG